MSFQIIGKGLFFFFSQEIRGEIAQGAPGVDNLTRWSLAYDETWNALATLGIEN